MAEKKKISLQIIICYFFTAILLIITTAFYIAFSLTTLFDCYPEKMFIVYELLDNSLGEGLASIITVMVFPWLCFIAVGIYYLVSHKHYKRLPSKLALFSWLFFLIFFALTYVIALTNVSWSTFFNDYIWYPGLTFILLSNFIFNTIDFARLFKSTKLA